MNALSKNDGAVKVDGLSLDIAVRDESDGVGGRFITLSDGEHSVALRGTPASRLRAALDLYRHDVGLHAAFLRGFMLASSMVQSKGQSNGTA